MNNRYFCQEEWVVLLSELKRYSFGECMYAVMSCGEINSKKDLLNISDEEMYTLIKRTVTKEIEE